MMSGNRHGVGIDHGGRGSPGRALLRWLKWGSLLMVWAVLAWRVVVVNMAEHYAQRWDIHDPSAALRWHAGQPQALLRQGLLTESSELERRAALLRKAIEANPTDGYAYAELALTLERQGSPDQALALGVIADELAPMRAAVQVKVAELWARQGRVPDAVRHLGRALELDPQLAKRAFPALLAVAEQPQALPAFADLLSHGLPTWWARFFSYSAREAEKLETIDALYRIRSELGKPGPGERRRYMERLQQEGLWQDAYFVWLNTLEEEHLAVVGNIYNGGFELPISGEGFDWRVPPVDGALVETLPVYGATGDKALHVVFQGRPVKFRHLYQTLLLQPGRYQLQGRVWPDSLRASQGMEWSVRCIAEAKQALASSERFLGKGQWRRFAFPFTVPAEDCSVQELRLELKGRFERDLEVSGALWFDDLSIIRLE